MKKFTLTATALTLVLAGTAFAKEKTVKTTTTTTTTSESAAAPRVHASSATSNMDFAVGFSTFGGGGTLATPALSGKFNLGTHGSVQALLAMTSQSPFQFSVGGVYRHRLFGDGDPGFHVGAGLNLGTEAGAGGNEFFLNLFPLFGFHFPLGGSLKRITLCFDGGVNFHITPGFVMSVGPLSAVGGGSIHYQL